MFFFYLTTLSEVSCLFLFILLFHLPLNIFHYLNSPARTYFSITFRIFLLTVLCIIMNIFYSIVIYL